MWSFNTFFPVVVGTSYDIVTVLGDNCKVALSHHSFLQFHTDASDTWDFYYRSIRIRFCLHNFPWNLFADSYRPCSSCTQFQYRRLHSHNFGIVSVRKSHSGPTSWNNNIKSTDCRFLPDVEDRYDCSQFRNLIWPDRHPLMKEHPWLCTLSHKWVGNRVSLTCRNPR